MYRKAEDALVRNEKDTAGSRRRVARRVWRALLSRRRLQMPEAGQRPVNPPVMLAMAVGAPERQADLVAEW
jgi:hypothetical protein